VAILPALLSEGTAPTWRGSRVAPAAAAEPPRLAVLPGQPSPRMPKTPGVWGVAEQLCMQAGWCLQRAGSRSPWPSGGEGCPDSAPSPSVSHLHTLDVDELKFSRRPRTAVYLGCDPTSLGCERVFAGGWARRRSKCRCPNFALSCKTIAPIPLPSCPSGQPLFLLKPGMI